MRQKRAWKFEQRAAASQARAVATARALLPDMPRPTRYVLGMGLLLLCLWLPAFASLFRR